MYSRSKFVQQYSQRVLGRGKELYGAVLPGVMLGGHQEGLELLLVWSSLDRGLRVAGVAELWLNEARNKSERAGLRSQFPRDLGPVVLFAVLFYFCQVSDIFSDQCCGSSDGGAPVEACWGDGVDGVAGAFRLLHDHQLARCLACSGALGPHIFMHYSL